MAGHRLHPGPGQPAAEVAADQRARVRLAMAEMVYERGYPQVTVRELIKRARVSKPTFYKLYAGKEDCFHAAYAEAAAAAVGWLAEATRGSVGRSDLVERGLKAFAGAVIDQPAAAFLGLLGPLAVGDAARDRMRKTENDFAGLVHRRLGEVDDGFELPAPVAHGVVAGVGRVARERLSAADPLGFRSDIEELASWALAITDPMLLQLGSAAAGWGGVPPKARSIRPRELPGSKGEEQALILEATLRLSAGGGYERLTAVKIATLAGVSQRCFDANFAGVEDCFIRAIEVGVNAVVAEALAAFESADQWAIGVHRALGAISRCFAEEPGLARLIFVEIFVPGRAATRKGAGILAALAKGLGQRTAAEERSSLVAAEASVGAIWTLFRRTVASGRGSDLPSLGPTLSWLALAPSIGGEGVLELLRDGS